MSNWRCARLLVYSSSLAASRGSSPSSSSSVAVWLRRASRSSLCSLGDFVEQSYHPLRHKVKPF